VNSFSRFFDQDQVSTQLQRYLKGYKEFQAILCDIAKLTVLTFSVKAFEKLSNLK
jgi:hypothetical protein